MTRVIVLMLVLSHIILVHTTNHEYFEYSFDCPESCIIKNESCSISEPERNDFVTQCYTNSNTCRDKASIYVVCLTPDGRALGGSLIWADYKEMNYPDPAPHRNVYLSILTHIICFIFGTIVSAVGIFIFIKYSIRRREDGYEAIPSGSEVYQSTVEAMSPERAD